MPFNIGDIVYLKSESKAMTVIGYGSSQNNGYIDLANWGSVGISAITHAKEK